MTNNSTGSDDNNDAYDYTPSKPAALVFTALFAVSLLIHIGQSIHYRAWWVWPLVFGLMLEASGFGVRYYSILHDTQLGPAIYSTVAIIVAPAFIAAQNYMLVGRLMSYLGSQYSPMSHHIITKVFVASDFISIFSQTIGGSMLSSTNINTLHVGYDILIGALVFQVAMFLLFIGVTIVFDVRSRRGLGGARKPLQPLFIAFYASAGMIMIRSIYRLYEFTSVKITLTDATGYTLTHEWPLYAFDALPITIACFVLNAIYAGRYLPRKKGERIDGTYEEPGPSRVCGCCCIYKRPRPVKRPFGAQDVGMKPLSSQSVV